MTSEQLAGSVVAATEVSFSLSDWGPPATSVTEAIAVMQAIDASLPPTDGVACFNRMYLAVTQRVGEAIAGQRFENRPFLDRLDVRFANLYFDAWHQDRIGAEVEGSWRPLFERRDNEAVAPLQFALAGMNAHINHDLPLAVTSTCEDLGLEPERGTPHYRDYCTTNRVLGEVEPAVKAWFMTGLVAEIDDLLDDVGDTMEMWSIAGARDLAWENCELLWGLREHPRLRTAFLATLERMVGLAGHGILL